MADTDFPMKPEAGKDYALSGKIVLSAIVLLFAVFIFIVFFHLYARWYIIHLRRRQLQRRRQMRGRGRPHVVLLADNSYTVSSTDRGLEKAVLDSLPVYHHSSKAGTPSECAVCLSEFQEGEFVRHLPKCSHSFHTECIDMWFSSHSTCPLCRSPVEHVVNQMNPVLTVNIQFHDVNEPDPASSSRSNPTHPRQQDEVGRTTSIEGRGKGLDFMAVRTEVPPRRAHSEDDSAQSPTGFSSPGNGLAYLKRILSMSIRSPTSGTTPCDTGTGSSMDTNGDLESCTRESSPDSSRVQTPR